MDTVDLPKLGIVDDPSRPHGRAMQRAARVGGFVPRIRWISPSLQLAVDLRSLPRSVRAVAVPVEVLNGGPGDLFTEAVVAALLDLQQRGIRVFVAAGNRRANVLARGGISVAPCLPVDRHRLPVPWRSARLWCGRADAGTSGACVRAGAIALLFATKRTCVTGAPRAAGSRSSEYQ